MIEVVFICDACGKRSEPVAGNYIDPYDYHDAPTHGFTAWEPTRWKNDGFRCEVLCDDHSGYEPPRSLKIRGAGETKPHPDDPSAEEWHKLFTARNKGWQ